MSLWVCRGCTAAYSVGALACPQCGSTDYQEQGAQGMPKITVQGGPTNAAADAAIVTGASWGDPPDENAASVTVSVDGVDQDPGEVVEFEGEPSFEPLPEAVEGETPEDVEAAKVVPEAWTVADLKTELDKREVQYPSRSTKDELVALLQGVLNAEASDG